MKYIGEKSDKINANIKYLSDDEVIKIFEKTFHLFYWKLKQHYGCELGCNKLDEMCKEIAKNIQDEFFKNNC